MGDQKKDRESRLAKQEQVLYHKQYVSLTPPLSLVGLCCVPWQNGFLKAVGWVATERDWSWYGEEEGGRAAFCLL